MGSFGMNGISLIRKGGSKMGAFKDGVMQADEFSWIMENAGEVVGKSLNSRLSAVRDFTGEILIKVGFGKYEQGTTGSPMGQLFTFLEREYDLGIGDSIAFIRGSDGVDLWTFRDDVAMKIEPSDVDGWEWLL